jgi:hypothetical protein
MNGIQLHRFVAQSDDFERDARFLEAIGLRRFAGGRGWAAFGSDQSDGPVELVQDASPGFSAPGFLVPDVYRLHDHLSSSAFPTTEIRESTFDRYAPEEPFAARGPHQAYFFAEDPSGRWWQFFEYR